MEEEGEEEELVDSTSIPSSSSPGYEQYNERWNGMINGYEQRNGMVHRYEQWNGMIKDMSNGKINGYERWNDQWI